MYPDQLINFSDEPDGNPEDENEGHQTSSIQDESLTSSLTRTETFELIPKGNADSSPVATPSKNILLGSRDEVDSVEDDAGDNVNTPTPYAPTTRTGLKPKTFTTPTNIRSKTSTSGSSAMKSSQSTSKQLAREDSTKTKSSTVPSPKSVNLKQAGVAPISAKRTSMSGNILETAQQDISTGKIASVKTKTASSIITGKGKQTLLARALPISMERSQSPGLNALKGVSINFIEANKRLVSQIDKKNAPPVEPQPNVYDSETEPSETSSSIQEPIALDNIISQLDKFTLVSFSMLSEILSKMFTDGILHDTVLLLKDDRQIKAHKCILAARSAYLSEYISKLDLPSLETEDKTETKLKILKIDLTKFTYPVAYFCILHLYSGVVKVPEDMNLDELAKLTHLLHVNTLKQVCIHHLRMNYCHFFHRPCSVCSVGVLKTLPLAWRYDYTELYSKCLHWIGAHFAAIFCLKEFSELKPHDLVEECYKAALSQLTPNNIIPKTIECQKLLKSLPRVKWSESTICLVGRQLEDFCHYVADNYEKILQSDSFLSLGKNCWECEILEENLLAAMNHLKPDSGCKTLIQLHKIECSIESYCEDPRSVSDSFASLISKMRKYCERYLLKEAAAVVHCSSWRRMNPSLQKRIRDQAIITADFDEPAKQLASKPKLASMSRVSNQHSPQPATSSGSDGTRSPGNRSTPESRLKSPSTTYLSPPKNKTAAARHIKVLK